MRLSALFLLLCAGLRAQQTGIEGTVVHSVTKAPLPGAHLRFITGAVEGITQAYGAISDRNGHFSIIGMKPGSYIMAPELRGFVFQPPKGGAVVTNLAVKAGKVISGQIVELSPRALIIGHVLDDNGDPVVGATVQVSPSSSETLAALPTTPSSTVSDDRGEFRLAVGPGKYHLKADPPKSSDPTPEIRADGEVSYATTYYPSAPAPASAGVVEAAAGADISGIDVRLQRQRNLSVRGFVRGIPENGARPTVQLRSGDTPQTAKSQGTSADAEGRFAFSKVQPGAYRVLAIYSGGTMISQTVNITVENDVAGIDLQLTPGAEFAGKLVFDGDVPGTTLPQKYSIRLEPQGDLQWIKISPGETDAQGTFHISGVAAAKYRVRVQPLPEGAYVKSIVLDGVAGANDLIDFTHGARAATVNIVLSRNAGQVTGKVLTKDGEPLTGTIGMVFIVKSPEDIDPNNYIRVQPNAQYSAKGLAPGKYRIIPLDVLKFAGYQGPDFMKNLFAKAEEIELKEGDRITKDVKAMDKGDIDAKK